MVLQAQLLTDKGFELGQQKIHLLEPLRQGTVFHNDQRQTPRLSGIPK